ncbi:MAG: aminoacyl-tRNA hydrolase [Capsulimonadaceae bacterium]|nr:aminoacyl-tRNA hydrolase [Capsulimonadaceae bacterium]
MPGSVHLIVGLGNPGREYHGTRHNVGFDVVEAFALRHKLAWGRIARRSRIAEGLVDQSRVFVMEPQTFMNLSGEAVAAFVHQKPIEPSSILVVSDDINLPVGKIRIRPSGSDGGHNGLKSIAAHLHTKDFPRVRIGVGAPGDPAQQVDFVLGRFTNADRKLIDDTVDRAVCALEAWLADGLEMAMNKYNG